MKKRWSIKLIDFYSRFIGSNISINRCFLIIISFVSFCSAKSQKIEDLWKIDPVNEYALEYSTGKISAYNYQDTLGKSYFTNYHNRNFAVSFLYSHWLGDRSKLTTGLSVNGMETSKMVEFDTVNIPGSSIISTDSYFTTGEFAFFSTPYDYYYFDIPLFIEYRLLNIRNRHQIWVGAGVDFTFFSEIESSESSFYQTEDSVLTLYSFKGIYGIKSFTAMPMLRMYYSWYPRPVHQFKIGLTARFNKQNIYEGTYDFLPDYPNSHAAGRVSNPFSYIGLSLAYSFNDRYHNYIRNSKALESKKINPDWDEVINDKNEIILWAHLYGYQFPHQQQKTNDLELDSKYTEIIMAGMDFKHYINPQYNWQAGARIGGEMIQFKNTNWLEALFAIDFPMGINHSQNLSKRWNMEYGFNIYPFINIYDPRVYAELYNTDYSGHRIMTATYEVNDFSRFGVGINPNIKFSFDLKNRNKIYMILAYNLDINPTFKIDYSILQDDASFYSNSLSFRRNFIDLSFAYAFTAKRHRWRMGKI